MKNIPFGKRLKSVKEETLFYRFPDSEDRETLPAGRPSPIIESYIMQGGGYYQLKGDDQHLYLKDSDHLKVVDKDEPDESSLFMTAGAAVSDWFGNFGRDVKRNYGYVEDGFSGGLAKTVDDLFNFGSGLRLVALMAIPVIILIVIALILIRIR